MTVIRPFSKLEKKLENVLVVPNQEPCSNCNVLIVSHMSYSHCQKTNPGVFLCAGNLVIIIDISSFLHIVCIFDLRWLRITVFLAYGRTKNLLCLPISVYSAFIQSITFFYPPNIFHYLYCINIE